MVLSFVLVAIFVKEREAEHPYARREVPAMSRLAQNRGVPVAGSVLGVLVLATIIATGYLGAPGPTENPAEYLTWIYFWAATVILSGLVGNLFAWLNPWRAIHDALAAIRPSRHGNPRPYPEHLGYWPAVVAYFGFAYFELGSGLASHPRWVASMAVVYTVYTLAMMQVFGRDTWLQRGEFFSVLFSLIGAFSPVEIDDKNRFFLRPYAVTLGRLTETGWDMVAFILLTLATLAFDGFTATPVWASIYNAVSPAFDSLGALAAPVIKLLGLLTLTLVFAAVYAISILAVARFGGETGSIRRTAALFAYTLIPIALVYNAAHNYSYMVIQGQGLIPLLADPLHRGWHLLPTAGYKPSFDLADAGFVWYLQVVLIVLGHVLAVYVAHIRALAIFPRARAALRSQYPMLVLMVAYTAVSLWILAQPNVEAG